MQEMESLWCHNQGYVGPWKETETVLYLVVQYSKTLHMNKKALPWIAWSLLSGSCWYFKDYGAHIHSAVNVLNVLQHRFFHCKMFPLSLYYSVILQSSSTWIMKGILLHTDGNSCTNIYHCTISAKKAFEFRPRDCCMQFSLCGSLWFTL